MTATMLEPEVAPRVTGKMSTLNESGDTRITWDKDNAQDVAAARDAFNRLVAHGSHIAFSVKGGDQRQDERITSFNAELEHILLVPQYQGG